LKQQKQKVIETKNTKILVKKLNFEISEKIDILKLAEKSRINKS